MDPANKATWCKPDDICADFEVAADFAAATSEAKLMVDTESESQGGRDDELQPLIFRLRELLALSPSELKILPADSEVSADNVARLNHQLRQKSARIGYLYAILGFNTAALKRSQADADALRAALANATAEIEGVRKSLAASVEENDNHRRALSQSKHDAAALSSDLAERSLIIEKLRTELANATTDTVALRADLSDRSLEIEKLRAELANWPITVANVRAELEAVRKSFLDSYTWRVTAPLRWFKHKLVRLSHFWHP